MFTFARKTAAALLAAFSLTAGSCQLDRPRSPTEPDKPPEWVAVSPSFDRRVMRLTREGKTYELIVYRFGKSEVEARLRYQNPPLRLEEWAALAPNDLVINGAYFTDEYLPTGRFVSEGKTIVNVAYEDDRSGTVILDDGGLALYDTAEQIIPKRLWRNSFQTYPVLIHRSGTPGVQEDSEKLARRTVLGEDAAGNGYVIIVDRTPISLYALMQILLASDLDLAMALNLDGGPSTGLHADLNDFTETILPLTVLPIVLSFAERASD